MRKHLKVLVFLCCLLMAVSMVQPVEAKKFDSKAAKKKITVTYKKVPNGVLAIYKNKNKFAVKLSGTMRFRDSSNKAISTEKLANECLGPKSTAALLYLAPVNEVGDVINYANYKGSFSVSKTPNKSYAKKISIQSEIGALSGNFAAVNMSGKNLDYIHVTTVFYDGNQNITYCQTKNINCHEKMSIDQFTVDYIGIVNKPQTVKVYVDWAY